MKDYYEQLYGNNSTHFGLQPSPIALLLIQQCRSGKLLDLGCGQGRDALYFAHKGMQVTAIDISPTAISDLKKHAQKAGLTLDAREQDMHHLPAEEFDAIFSDFALQMIAPEKRLAYIDNLKITYPAAIHAHVVPLSGACFGDAFIFGDLLKKIYADWHILFYEEAWVLSPAPNKNGEHYLIREARIIAKHNILK
jgi:SAM-dependent methyltransferase